MADDGAESPELRADPLSPAEHISRLDRLITDQADELAALHTTLREVTALCDLADWAAESGSGELTATVRVDELRRTLARHRQPGPAGS
ncbi:hypothetical protein [Jatrophihabitans sp.]|uniref:hypothetical protein n=1 Tax=Jatrophihabitans sp. TaxID=1932789 RepID=UPI002C5A23CB|nr:hypothetical protein [Jatrophihabitans sp.]